MGLTDSHFKPSYTWAEIDVKFNRYFSGIIKSIFFSDLATKFIFHFLVGSRTTCVHVI
jgi:hypothetical protein